MKVTDMGFRFRKSIKIAKGVKINIGKKGISSVSVGGKGASLNIGKKGVYGNVSAPATGLSYRGRLDAPKTKSQQLKGEKPQKIGILRIIFIIMIVFLILRFFNDV